MADDACAAAWKPRPYKGRGCQGLFSFLHLRHSFAAFLGSLAECARVSPVALVCSASGSAAGGGGRTRHRDRLLRGPCASRGERPGGKNGRPVPTLVQKKVPAAAAGAARAALWWPFRLVAGIPRAICLATGGSGIGWRACAEAKLLLRLW
jgi:hypothetical protein